MTIFYNPPDLRFYFMAITFFISLIAGVIAFKNYRLTKSIDLGLITISHFSYTVWMFMWLTRLFVYFDIPYFVNHASCWPSQDPCGFDFIYLLFEFIEQLAWSTGWYALFLHSFRLFDFKNRSKIFKFILAIIFVEITALYFYVLSGVFTFWIEGTYDYGSFVYPTHHWFNKLWIGHFFSRSLGYPLGQIGLNFDLFILHLFIFIAYLQAKPVLKTFDFKLAKTVWMVYSLLISFVYLQFFFNDYSNAVGETINNPLYLYTWLSNYIDTSTIIQVLITAGFIPIMILILLYPKAMIMTESQLVSARNLYKLFDIPDNASKKFGVFELNTKYQISSYLKNLPEELKNELKIAKDS